MSVRKTHEIKDAELKEYIEEVENYPKDDDSFKNISSLLSNKMGFELSVEALDALASDWCFDVVLSTGTYGPIFGSAIAWLFKRGLVIAFPKGYIPGKTIEMPYVNKREELITLEIPAGSISPGQKVLIVDATIATGRTAKTLISLIEKSEAECIGILALAELKKYGGREYVSPYEVKTNVYYD